MHGRTDTKVILYALDRQLANAVVADHCCRIQRWRQSRIIGRCQWGCCFQRQRCCWCWGRRRRIVSRSVTNHHWPLSLTRQTTPLTCLLPVNRSPFSFSYLLLCINTCPVPSSVKKVSETKSWFFDTHFKFLTKFQQPGANFRPKKLRVHKILIFKEFPQNMEIFYFKFCSLDKISLRKKIIWQFSGGLKFRMDNCFPFLPYCRDSDKEDQNHYWHANAVKTLKKTGTHSARIYTVALCFCAYL